MVNSISDRDVWLAANVLVKQHGADAPIFAATRADEWLAAGDMDQYLLSKRILHAVDQLLLAKVPEGGQVM
ncbi:hypothetical protein [Nitrospirillum viridazoti]|uniref:Uncharacterized protein n=1 Tax=Nitrospirillum viridazoti CBAmc TaxID=1441467 RepID=A0A248JXH2_9PROT|nr:hypothetical protein [Nitrospirillum amazonense]ASG23240.1 hypothetical protein Y958_20635 [Nitrospirillum amazonense CBAmc]TWB38999.1 hypothetical protein FBZ91_106332 [Nitrospirillum amazonense]